MQEISAKTLFYPSRALVPFAGVFLLIALYVAIRLMAFAPLLLIIVLVPYFFFTFWWFLSLLVVTLTLKVKVSEEGLYIQQPKGGPFESEVAQIAWDEISSVSFEFENEISPAAFTGRNAMLHLTTKDNKRITIEHVMIIDGYADLFTIIQEYVPFVYQLPNEQIVSPRLRQMILGAVATIFLVILLLFVA